jgi:hypothetical protein
MFQLWQSIVAQSNVYVRHEMITTILIKVFGDFMVWNFLK